jgi:hypothetical protein
MGLVRTRVLAVYRQQLAAASNADGDTAQIQRAHDLHKVFEEIADRKEEEFVRDSIAGYGNYFTGPDGKVASNGFEQKIRERVHTNTMVLKIEAMLALRDLTDPIAQRNRWSAEVDEPERATKRRDRRSPVWGGVIAVLSAIWSRLTGFSSNPTLNCSISAQLR